MKSAACFTVACLVSTTVLALPSQQKPHGKDRIYDAELSSTGHKKDSGEHNSEYDHEAFLGADEARTFDQLTPEQSRERLRLLVPKVDTDKDGYVTETELQNWIKFTQNRYMEKNVAQEWSTYDTDGDGAVSWGEHKNRSVGPISDAEIEENESYKAYKDMMKRDKRRWHKADLDGDDRLNRQEFTAFLHPEEHEHMQPLVVEETLDDIDQDKDGRLNIDEYVNDLYSEEERKQNSEEPEWIKTERESFKTYRDKNKDGYMDKSEVRSWIIPDGYDHADAEAHHLIYEADTEPKDGKLTADEIVQKYDLFAGSQATDYGEALKRHEEF